MTRIYALPSDLPAQWQAHADAEDLIRRASNLVTNAIANSYFTVDDDGLPVGEDLTACRDATVIQVSTWLSTGVSPLTGYAGKGRTIASKGSNGSTVAYVVDMAQEAFLNALAEGVSLTPSAMVPLEAQGLLTAVLAGRYYRRLYNPVPSPNTQIDGGEG